MFFHRGGYGERLCYLIVFFCYLIALFFCFAPFLVLLPGGKELTGFSFFVDKSGGDFLGPAILGVIYGGFVLLFSGLGFFLYGSDSGDKMYWPLTVTFGLGFLSFIIVFNYYLISAACNPESLQVGYGAIVFDVLILIPWIPFFLLHHRYFSNRTSEPIFGTGLDEKPQNKSDKKD